jgi:WD40 repeat protein
MNRVWPDTFVEEVGLARNVSALRKILEDGSDQHNYIETVPKRGYRFRAEVREWKGVSDQSAERKQPPESAVLSVAVTKPQNDSVKEDAAVITETALGTRFPRWIWVTASLAVLSAAWLGWWLARTGTRTPEVAPVTVPLTSYPGIEAQPSFSPDGSQVAFSWSGEKQDNFDIYVKLIGPGTQLRH